MTPIIRRRAKLLMQLGKRTPISCNLIIFPFNDEENISMAIAVVQQQQQHVFKAFSTTFDRFY